MLKFFRILLAVISFAAVTTLFLDTTGYAASHWAWMARIQFVPALLALNVAVLVGLLLVTLLVGRVYCSVICPLGIWQDAANRVGTALSGKRKRRAGRFGFRRQAFRWRTGFLAAFAVLFVAGVFTALPLWLASAMDPYGIFGRSVTAWRWMPAMTGSATGIVVIFVVAATFITVTLMAFTRGRDYCNKVCPVGTLLGLVSRHAVLRPVIDTDKCNGCGQCARHCKASCIDPKAHAIDLSRCVVCMDCIEVCTQKAISFGPKRTKAPAPVADKPADEGRRAFLTGGAVLGAGLAFDVLAKTDGGLAPIKRKKASHSAIPLVPAGAQGVRHLTSACTTCQLCISHCPNGVLHPSTRLEGLMQPEMSFNDGWCRTDCTVCGDVCPTDAIGSLTVAEKSSVKIGTAVVDLNTCISAHNGVHCGSCARHCPAGAIDMVPVREGSDRLRPLVDVNACIGCGSCEYHCPVGRVASLPGDTAAIHVEAIDVHRFI